jgi:hypothetical protein
MARHRTLSVPRFVWIGLRQIKLDGHFRYLPATDRTETAIASV